MRIALEVQRVLDLEASRAHRRLFLYRLWTRVRFQQAQGWSEPHPALVDTGAPYSLIPLSVWPSVRTDHLLEVPLRGIVPGKHAEAEATLARVSGQLLGLKRVSPRLSLWAMLATTDQVPLILGWAGCLDRTRLALDGRRRLAWLEF